MTSPCLAAPSMPRETTTRVRAYFTGISLAIGFTIAIALPLGYWMLSYRSQSVELTIETKFNAGAIQDLIKKEPETWRLQTSRLQALITEDHTPTELPERRALYDEKRGFRIFRWTGRFRG